MGHGGYTVGLKMYLTKIMSELCKKDPDEDVSDLKVVLDRCKPSQAQGGFVNVEGVVACKCGTPIRISASPPNRSESELRAMAARDPDATLVVCAPPDFHDGGETMCASNLGGVAIRCPSCNNSYLAAWEFDCVMVDRELVLSGDAEEVPEHRSSGSDMTLKKLSRLIH